jgi:hypothetical protein
LPSTAQSDVRVVGTEPAALPAGPAVANNDPARKQQPLDLVRQARAALAAGGFARADALARQADAMGVPDKDFGPQDDRAWLVLMEIEKLQRRGGVVPAAAQTPLAGAQFPAAQAVYDPATDATRNMTVAAQNVPTLAPTDAAPTGAVATGRALRQPMRAKRPCVVAI